MFSGRRDCGKWFVIIARRFDYINIFALFNMSHTVGDRHIRQCDEFSAIISRRVGPELMINEYNRAALHFDSVVQGPRTKSAKVKVFFLGVVVAAECMCVCVCVCG